MMEDGERKDKLEQLYLTYRKELYYVAYRILNDYHDAEDVIQSAFVKLSKHLEKIGEIKCKKTRAYLVIIVRNLSIDRYNEKKRILPTDFSDENGDIPDEDSSLEDYVLHLELGRELAETLARLHTGYADILTLRYYYEYSNAEIAELINLSVDNVSLKLHRAKAALKKILSEGGGMDE
jgi:RNA polymerase sigma-70 factor (ECF subfamily)